MPFLFALDSIAESAHVRQRSGPRSQFALRVIARALQSLGTPRRIASAIFGSPGRARATRTFSRPATSCRLPWKAGMLNARVVVKMTCVRSTA